jgi:hypothetical protein
MPRRRRRRTGLEQTGFARARRRTGPEQTGFARFARARRRTGPEQTGFARFARARLIAAALAACSDGEGPATVPELGALGRPRVVTARDGGAAALVGGKMLWTFGDTLMTVRGADGFQYRSATAAWGDGRGLTLDEPLDAAGAPFQLLPYSEAELTYNRNGGPSERFALWPASVIPDGAGGALIFYSYLKVHAGTLNYEDLGSGVARLAAGSTVATRDPGLLFVTPEPGFATGGVLADGFVHLYACIPVKDQLDSECKVARAPLAEATTRAAWRVWDGTTWSAAMVTGATVLRGAPGDLSVSWNPHLGSYLAVHSNIFSDEVVFHTAPQPQGPWSAPRSLFVGLRRAGTHNYAAREHPALASEGGRQLVVSYAHPLGGFDGEVRLATPTLP